MQDIIIFYVERELAVQGSYLFDMLGNGIVNYSKHSNDFYLKFLTVDPSNSFSHCFIPETRVEETLKEPIPDNHALSKKMAGGRLKIEIGNEISKDDFISFQRGEELFTLFSKSEKYFLVEDFYFDLNEKDRRVLPLYDKVAKFYNLPFKSSPGSFNHIEGGYDIDAAFGGDSEAYWNID